VEGFHGVGAAVIVVMVEYCYAVAKALVSSKECFECAVDLERDVMYPWKGKSGLVGLVIGWLLCRRRI
jgi:hypothetical protein